MNKYTFDLRLISVYNNVEVLADDRDEALSLALEQIDNGEIDLDDKAVEIYDESEEEIEPQQTGYTPMSALAPQQELASGYVPMVAVSNQDSDLMTQIATLLKTIEDCAAKVEELKANQKPEVLANGYRPLTSNKR